MKVSSKSKRNRSNKSSHLIELNNERLATAGRPGTKSFMDPNKLFIGNLHYDATESHIRELFATYWGVPVDVVDERIESIACGGRQRKHTCWVMKEKTNTYTIKFYAMQ